MKSHRHLITQILSFIFLFVLCFVSLNIHDEILENTFMEYSFDERDEVLVPVIMYHSILDSKAKSGKYVITPSELEKDMVYLTDHGFTTVTTKDLIDFVYEDKKLPDKPVVLTFDDGYYNNYSYLYPLLKKHNMKAVISVIGKLSDQFSKEGDVLNNNYSHLTWDELRQMQKSGHIEILNHSYDMHSTKTRQGVKRKTGETDGDYLENIKKDIATMQSCINENLYESVPAFTYPFGFITPEASALIRDMGFVATYSCYEGVSTITKSPESLYEIRRYNRDGNTDTVTFFHKVLKNFPIKKDTKNGSNDTAIKK